MRFFDRNQTALRAHPTVEQMRQKMLSLNEILCDPGAPLPVKLKSSLAIFALHAAWIVLRDPTVTDEQRREAALQVALELIDADPDRACGRLVYWR